MKRVLLLFLTGGFLLLSGLSGCSSGAKRVAVFLYNGEDPFISSLYKELALQFSEIGCELSVYDAQNSQMVQNEQIETMLNDPVDLAIINPVDRLGAYTVIRTFRAKDIPLIYFNRQPLKKDMDLWDRCYYVGATAEQAGQLQAELAMKLFGGNPNELNRFDRNGDGMIQGVIIRGEQSHQDSEIRTREVRDTLAEKGFSFVMLTSVIANWSRSEAYEKMDEVINLYGDELEVIFANNDEMALGAIELMEDRAYFRDTDGNGRIDRQDADWIPVIGIDGLPEALRAIEEGTLYGTVINDEAAQARAIVDLAATVLTGRPAEDSSYLLQDGAYIWNSYSPYMSE